MEFSKWIIIFIFYKIAATEEIHSIECQPINGCSCTPTLPEVYEFHCSDYEPNVVIKIQPIRRFVDVQCTYDIDWDTKDLPFFNIDYANHLSFLQCNLPTSSFSELFHRLRINSTKVLVFEYCSDCSNFTLTSDYFENLPNLQKLSLSRSNIEYIDEDAFKSLDQLIELDLKFNRINLTNGLLKNKPNLKLLDLSENELTTLPSKLFQNLENVEVLFLWANKFTTINSSTFENLKGLQFLELSRNLIQSISEHAFYNLKNVKTISLPGNKLKSIPENLFVNNRLIEKIFLNENEDLVELPEKLFSNLTNLKSIMLNHCKLRYLPEKIFEGLISLQNLTLRRNELEYIPKDIFKDLMQLENVDLSYNQIKDLPDELFSTALKIKNLNLENNFLSSINKMYFYYLQSLEILNVKANKITWIDGHAFQKNINLKELMMADNEFDLPNYVQLFANNLQLQRLDLSNNNITSIPDEVRLILLQLEELDLSYNQIVYIQFSDILTVKQSIAINLSYNDIQTVDFAYAEIQAREQTPQDAISSNSGNRVVNLEGNPIVCNCEIYKFVQYFERIIDPMVPTLVTILANDLTCVAPSDFVGFPIKELKSSKLVCPLEHLGIEGEFTRDCAYSFRPWDTSLIVSCAEANFTEIPKLIYPKQNFYNQTEVHLQRNRLISGPKENMGYENVTRLYLSYNNIQEVSWIPPKIKVLELSNNNISHLNDTILKMLNKTSCTNITLGNNPWMCDCTIINLINFLVSSNIHRQQIDINAITCKEDGKHVVKLNIDEICSTSKLLYYVLGILFFSIALTIATFYALYYRFQQEIKIWLFAHNLCSCLVHEEEIDKDKKYDAFISYSHKDEEFIVKELQPVLETGPHPYKLCLHIRDFIAGEFISKQIVTSIADSRRTIVILSRNFLESEWGKMEFRTAHQQALQEGRARVILILYGDINVNKDLDDEFKAYISTNTYVKWGDPWFWNKLRYALPHSRIQIQKHQNIMVAINERLDRLDDKLDLINGSPSTPNPGSTPPAINVDPLLLKENPLKFTPDPTLTPPAESGLNPLLVTVNK